jgi:RHS repeat-associated protein
MKTASVKMVLVLSGLLYVLGSSQKMHGVIVGPPPLRLVLDDARDHGCKKTALNLFETCDPCQQNGRPIFWVSEPFINLWVSDQPVAYRTSTGEEIAFRLTYKQRNRLTFLTPYFPTNNWNLNWQSFVHVRSTGTGGDPPNHYYFTSWDAIVHARDGGEYYFTDTQVSDHGTGMQLLPMDGTNICYQPNRHGSVDVFGRVGFRLVYPDGSQDLFGLVSEIYGEHIEDRLRWVTNDYTAIDALLTEHIDPLGNRLTYYWDTNTTPWRLQSMVDCDGRTNTLSYSGSGPNRFLSRVDTPYDRYAVFEWETNHAWLQSMTDAEGLNSQFRYQPGTGYLTNILSFHTPGFTDTRFKHYEDHTMEDHPHVGNAGGSNLVNRSIIIMHHDQSKEAYLYRFEAAQLGIPASPSDIGLVPTNPPLTGLDTVLNTNAYAFYRNSYYWSRRQFAQLHTNELQHLNAADYGLASIKHWLLANGTVNQGQELTSALSWQREASPDGTTNHPGQVTWYDYDQKLPGEPWALVGPARLAGAARMLPDGSSWYSLPSYDQFGLPATMTTSYTPETGGVGSRTRSYNRPGAVGTETCTAFNTNVSTVAWTVPMLASVSGAPGTTVNFSGEVSYKTNTVMRSFNGTNFTFTTAFPRRLVLDVTDGENNVTRLFYNERGQLIGERRPGGLIVTNLYRSDGFLKEARHLDANRVPVRTNYYAFTNGLVAATTNASGLWVRYDWDRLQRLTGVHFPDGTSNQFFYAGLELSQAVDRLGNSWSADYDGMRQMKSSADRMGRPTYYDWCTCGGLESIADALGNTNVFERDFNEQVTRTVYNYGTNGYTEFNRNLLGQVTNRLDNSGLSVSYQYNNQGLLKRIYTANGTLLQVTYDIHDRPVTVVNDDNVTVGMTYDGLGRVRTRSYPNGGYEEFIYSTNGLATYRDPEGRLTHLGYDPAGRLRGLTNANLEVVCFDYDPAGNLTRLTDGRTNRTSWAYDLYGRVVAETNANNVLSWTNGYNALGLLTKRWTPEKGLATFAYDPNENLTNAAYPGFTDRYRFDPLNRLTNMVDATGTTTFTWTNFGAFMGALSAEDAPWSSYDTVSRIYTNRLLSEIRVTQPVGGTIVNTLGYDSQKRLKTIAAPEGTYTYHYAGAGDLVRQLNLPGGSVRTNSYGTSGELKQSWLKDPLGAVVDSHGYSYDLSWLRTNATRLGWVTNKYYYDQIGQLTQVLSFGPGNTNRLNETYGYWYDQSGNLRLRTNSATSVTFSSDKLNQLTNSTRSSYMTVSGSLATNAWNVTVNNTNARVYHDYTFSTLNGVSLDGVNTLTTKAVDWQNFTNTLVTSINLPASVYLNYDRNGNLTNDGFRGFEYDSADRLTAVYVPNAWRTEFVYDGLWRRRITREKAWQGGTWVTTNETRYVCLGRNPIQERNSANYPTVTYTRGLDLSGTFDGAGGIGGLLARTDATSSAFYYNDGAGNITTLINSQGQKQAFYVYDPFGNTVDMRGPLADPNRYRFSSKEYLPLPRIYHFGLRDYEPNLHRFLNQDPMGIAGGLNLHAFAHNNPLRYVDPHGAQAIETAIAVTVGTASSGGVGTVLTVVAGGATVTAAPSLAPLALGVVAIPAAASVLFAMENTPPSPVLYPNVHGGNPIPNSIIGYVLGPGEYRDQNGNIRDVAGNIVRDKYGRPTNNSKKRCPPGITATAPLPELRISASKYPELAENILNAQRAGHPDVLTHGGEAVIDANRNAALHQPYRDFVPNLGPHLSRDEYPFASSLEGGAGSWVGHVPVQQQQAQGGLIRAMNLKPGDRYRVVIVP